MAQKLNLTICHLYPDLMDTYGDTGNIITLIRRCTWRNITTNLIKVSLHESLPRDIDILFFGGGQDKVQELVSKDLLKKIMYYFQFEADINCFKTILLQLIT